MSVFVRALPRPSVTAEREGVASEAVAVPHLAAALLAGVLFFAGLAVISRYADSVLARDVHALAGSRHRQKVVGLVLQREALRHQDLLPLYGTSEVDSVIPYHARDLFADAPTGFSTFTLGKPGGLVLTTTESLGALGTDLRGRKLVISLSPTMFQLQDGPTLDRRYAGNLFPLQALTLLLNTDLSLTFRQQFASRLLSRPSTLVGKNVVEQAATLVAHPVGMRRPLYYAFLPIARLQLELLGLQDRIRELGHSLTSTNRDMHRAPRTLDWAALVESASVKSQAVARDNPFGLDDRWWHSFRQWASAQRNASSDQQFLRELSQSEMWVDLEQLLQLLKELHANPLILSMPFHGPFLRYTGVSAAASRQYYDRVRQLADEYGVRAVVLDDHEMDPYFFRDLGSHLSAKGWVYYDHAIDAFYHDALQ
jgi:D-alanine transfer protein